MEKPAYRTPHFKYLDGARGIAAFSVFIYHILDVGKWKDTTGMHVLKMVFNGGDAVSFFFMLSGFVLSFKYLWHKPDQLHISMKQYVNSRLWRIFPAYWATLLLCFMANRHIYSLRILPELWEARGDFFGEASLIANMHNYNLSGWTLTIELAISILLPFFMMVIVRSRKWFFGMAVLYFLLSRIHPGFLLHFFLGITAAWYFTELSRLQTSHPRLYKWRWAILAVALFFFTLRQMRITDPGFRDALNFTDHYLFLSDFNLTGIASLVLVIYAFNSLRVQSLLSLKPILYLGKISYSIYLVQTVWAWNWNNTIMPRLQPYTGDGWLLFIAYAFVGGAGVILTASFSYYLVERPAMALGKKVYLKYISKAEQPMP